MAASLCGFTIIVDMIAAILLAVVSQYRIHIKDKTIRLINEN